MDLRTDPLTRQCKSLSTACMATRGGKSGTRGNHTYRHADRAAARGVCEFRCGRSRKSHVCSCCYNFQACRASFGKCSTNAAYSLGTHWFHTQYDGIRGRGSALSKGRSSVESECSRHRQTRFTGDGGESRAKLTGHAFEVAFINASVASIRASTPVRAAMQLKTEPLSWPSDHGVLHQ